MKLVHCLCYSINKWLVMVAKDGLAWGESWGHGGPEDISVKAGGCCSEAGG